VILPAWLNELFSQVIPPLFALLGFILCYGLYTAYSKKRIEAGKISRIGSQLVYITLALIGLAAFILAMPIADSLKTQLFSLIGIVVSATIALSSTTLMGNALGGIMLNGINSLKAGDFIQVNDFAGRITERGLLHVEIQSEDRNLTVLPNLYLVTHPYRIIHSKGTIISVTVSLGYDVNRQVIEKALIDAATGSGLESPFMQITQLGDFSVSYKISGVLKEVKQRVTAQSELFKHVMDSLHHANIEIVSPTFMNTLARNKAEPAIPEPVAKPQGKEKEEKLLDIESIVFDKAEEAESKDTIKQKIVKIDEGIEKLIAAIKASEDEKYRESLKQRIGNLESIKARMITSLEVLEKASEKQ